MDKTFIENKKNTLEKLKLAKKENKVDIGIIPLIDIINSSENYYTSSSCFGRIVLLELPVIGDKKNAKFIGKWHRTILRGDLLSVISKAKKGQLWFLAQSPIIHIICISEAAADKILKLGISCGFKNSGLKSIIKNYVVEICSTERLDAPVGKNGFLFCTDQLLELLIETANDVFIRSNQKLKKFEKKLNKII